MERPELSSARRGAVREALRHRYYREPFGRVLAAQFGTPVTVPRQNDEERCLPLNTSVEFAKGSICE
jgi:hypothetical protein